MSGIILLLTIALGGTGVLPRVDSLSLREAESRALAANPRLRAAQLDAAAAGKRTAATIGRHFGSLDAVGTYNAYESDRAVRPMALSMMQDPAKGLTQLPWDRTQDHYGVTWQIPLLAAGTLIEGDAIARLSQRATEHLALFTRDEIRYNVRAAYRNALIAEHALTAAHAYQRALERDSADAVLKSQLGTWAPVDLAKVIYALRGATAQAAEFDAQRQTAQAYLAALMGELPPATGFVLVDVPATGTDDALSTPVSVTAALAARNDLLATRDGTRMVERRRRLSREAFAPQLMLQGTWLRNDAPSLAAPLDTREVALVLKVPLFSGLSRVFALQEADVNVRAAKARERAKELEVATQVVEAQGRLASARALLQAGEAQRLLGRDVARVERVRLEQGTGRMEDYLTARGQELAGETAYWRGLYAFQSATDYMDFVSAQGGRHE